MLAPVWYEFHLGAVTALPGEGGTLDWWIFRNRNFIKIATMKAITTVPTAKYPHTQSGFKFGWHKHGLAIFSKKNVTRFVLGLLPPISRENTNELPKLTSGRMGFYIRMHFGSFLLHI